MIRDNLSSIITHPNVVPRQQNNIQKNCPFTMNPLHKIEAAYLLLKANYSNTSIGIWWETISTTGTVFVLFLVFGGNYENKLSYLLYLSIGFWLWCWVALILTSGSNQFRVKKSDLNRPGWTTFDFLIWCSINRILRHLIATSMLFCIIIYLSGPSYLKIMILFYVYIFVLDVIWSTIFSTLSLVLLDVKFILQQLRRVLMFVTPIFWGFEYVPGMNVFRDVLFYYNPIMYLVASMRHFFGFIGHHGNTTVILGIILGFSLLSLIAVWKIKPKYWRNIQ